MEFHFQHKTYTAYGGHDYLDMVNRILDAESLFCGSAIQRIDIQVNFKPYEHVKLMYDEVNNRTKESPDYLFQRRKKTLKIIYLSMVSSHEEEESYYRGQPLEAEKFNELCYEFRDYLSGIKQHLTLGDDFHLSELLAFMDKRFSILPLSDSALNLMFEEYEEEQNERYKKFSERQKAELIDCDVDVKRPKYWDTSVLDNPGESETSVFPFEKVSWMYGDRKFDDFDKFVKELTLYSWNVSDNDGQIKDFELLKCSAVRIKFFGRTEREEACSDKAIDIELYNKTLSFLEFMFITNNELFAYLEGTEHVFYEGYEFLDNENDLPVIQLIQGS